MKTNEPMKVSTIKEFAQLKGFTTIAPNVRSNTNNYPFITFINAKNEAENVYFSKKASSLVKAGEAITKDMLKTYQIGETHNEAGELRIKLISNSERLDLNTLWD